MLLTLTRQNITITGTYTPTKESPNGLKLGATFRVITPDPNKGGKITLTVEEWGELRRLYSEELTKN